MSEAAFRAAVRDWTAALSPEQVCVDERTLREYESNVTAIDRKIPAVIYPMTTEEVVEVVKLANRHLVPLYPIGRGMNWGIGSRVPAKSGSVVVDLQRMNRIHEINVAGQYAVVEPGVSQGQLANHLAKEEIPLVYNVNGSGAEASVVGNALERGIGYFSSRADALSGLEVVLGTGEILRTGFAHYANCNTTHIYRHGHGPFLDGLFSQGNFGIITAAGVDLLPKQESYKAAILRVKHEEQLASLVGALVALRSRDAIQGVVHIGNWRRAESVVGPLAVEYFKARGEAGPWAEKIEQFMRAEGYSAWSAVIGLAGSRRQVATMQREIRAGLPSSVTCRFVDERRLDFLAKICRLFPRIPFFQRKRVLLPAIRELHGLSMGQPTNETVKSVYWASGQDIPDAGAINPDMGRSGLMYVAPMLPMQEKVAIEVVAETNRIFSSRGFHAYITLNLIDRKCMEAVINLCFDRGEPEQVALARQAVSELTHWLRARGWLPYRLRTDEMQDFLSDSDTFWQTVRQLKEVFDPNNIIAPGRYNLK